MIHCEQNTGYAIEKLEGIFNAAALKAGFLESQIHWSFSKVHEPSQQIYELDFHNGSVAKQLAELLAVTKFDTILAFDLPFPSSIVSVAKQFKVGRVISYWGASMSDINKWPLLGLKKLEYLIKQRRSADLYLFESKAMQRTATHGRGLPIGKTHVIPLGVDLCQYFPEEKKVYTHLQLKIPQGRKVIFYSGHMEARKGVGTIIKAALKLAQDGRIAELHSKIIDFGIVGAPACLKKSVSMPFGVTKVSWPSENPMSRSRSSIEQNEFRLNSLQCFTSVRLIFSPW